MLKVNMGKYFAEIWDQKIKDAFFSLCASVWHFTMLGDGRALLIGERKNSNGELIGYTIKG